jgi:DNA-binding NtrC family response regulator
MAKILLVDDDAAQRGIMGSILSSEGHSVTEADGVDAALRILADQRTEVVFTDLKMHGRGGLELVEEARRCAPPPEVVVITAFGSVDTAVRAMHLGAYDYLTKPIEREELLMAAARAAEKYTLRVNGQVLRDQMARQSSQGIVACSAPMREILALVEKVAATDATVFIRGESGTGKERIACLLHYQSPRSLRPMQSVNCASLPENLLESELFGHEKGSFTGALARKEGIVESADGGTLFLDEIADMSLNTQARVLRMLQEKEIRRVGGTAVIRVDVRILAATNKNIEECLTKGSFREDLYYRLNVIPIVIPPLRERPDDIPALIDFFLSRRAGRRTVSSEALELMKSYRWPGNVRELEAVMERCIIIAPGDIIGVDDLPMEIRKPASAGGKPAWQLPGEGIVFEDLEKNLIEQALRRANGTMTEAAKLMGMTYRTFQYRAAKFGLVREE